MPEITILFPPNSHQLSTPTPSDFKILIRDTVESRDPTPRPCNLEILLVAYTERWGPGVETQKNVRGVFGEWGRVPFNEPYAPSLSTIYDGA